MFNNIYVILNNLFNFLLVRVGSFYIIINFCKDIDLFYF